MSLKSPALYAIPPATPRRAAAPKKKSVVELRARAVQEQRREQDVKQVIERAHSVLNRLEERARQYARQIAALQKRRALANARAAWIEDDILRRMSAAQRSLVDGWHTTFKAVPCPVSVSIIDESLIPALYLRTTEVTTPNKFAIREAIESDVAVPGARLVQNISLQRK